MRYKSILFDLDGTLTDPFEGITRCVQHALICQDIHISDRRELAGFIGPPLAQAFVEFHGMTWDQAQKAVADYRERFARLGMYENRLYADIDELLSALKTDGRQLFVATSKPWSFARPIVEHFGLARYFGKVYGSELDGQRTEKLALIAYIMREQKLVAEQTLMIGDRRFDIEGGRHNGLVAAAVSYGYGRAGELKACQPDLQFDSPDAIADYLLGGRGQANPRRMNADIRAKLGSRFCKPDQA